MTYFSFILGIFTLDIILMPKVYMAWKRLDNEFVGLVGGVFVAFINVAGLVVLLSHIVVSFN